MSRGNNNHWGAVSIEYPHASVFYDIQWKWIRGIPLDKNCTITQTQQIKMHILNLIQINLIYNTNRNLFLLIEFLFLRRTFTILLPRDGRATCRIKPNRNKQRTCLCNGGISAFTFRYQGNGATHCQYIDTTRKAIDCATTMPLTFFYIMKLCSRLFVPVLSKLSKRRQI